MKKYLFLFLLYSLLPAEIRVDSDKAGLSKERLQRLNRAMHDLVDQNKIAGVQTAIFRNGSIGHYNTYGFSDINKKKPLDDNSIFRIYSMTKPIVSVALMMLYEEGKFLLTDPVYKYIPEFKNLKVQNTLLPNRILTSEKWSIWPFNKINYVRKAKEPMLIIDLLRHTSGLGYGWGPNTYVDRKYRKANILNRINNKDFIRELSSLPLYHEPGSGWRYGVSTDVCGYLIEVLSGQNLDEFLTDRVFKPLNMPDTHFQLPSNKIERFTSNYINNIPKRLRKLARMFGITFNSHNGLKVVDNADSSEFSKNVTFLSGGGGLISTSNDYMQFCKMILNKGELDGKRILSPKTIDFMMEDHLKFIENKGGSIALPNNGTGFGIGFSVVKDNSEKKILGSEGTVGWGGAAGTYFGIDPKENMIFILMIQLIDFNDLEISDRFKTLVYQSIVENLD